MNRWTIQCPNYSAIDEVKHDDDAYVDHRDGEAREHSVESRNYRPDQPIIMLRRVFEYGPIGIPKMPPAIKCVLKPSAHVVRFGGPPSLIPSIISRLACRPMKPIARAMAMMRLITTPPMTPAPNALPYFMAVSPAWQ